MYNFSIGVHALVVSASASHINPSFFMSDICNHRSEYVVWILSIVRLLLICTSNQYQTCLNRCRFWWFWILAGQSVLLDCFVSSKFASCLTKPRIFLNINDLHGPVNNSKKLSLPRFAFLCYSLFHQVRPLHFAPCYYVCNVFQYIHLSGFLSLRFAWFCFFTFCFSTSC